MLHWWEASCIVIDVEGKDKEGHLESSIPLLFLIQNLFGLIGARTFALIHGLAQLVNLFPQQKIEGGQRGKYDSLSKDSCSIYFRQKVAILKT